MPVVRLGAAASAHQFQVPYAKACLELPSRPPTSQSLPGPVVRLLAACFHPWPTSPLTARPLPPVYSRGQSSLWQQPELPSQGNSAREEVLGAGSTSASDQPSPLPLPP